MSIKQWLGYENNYLTGWVHSWFLVQVLSHCGGLAPHCIGGKATWAPHWHGNSSNDTFSVLNINSTPSFNTFFQYHPAFISLLGGIEIWYWFSPSGKNQYPISISYFDTRVAKPNRSNRLTKCLNRFDRNRKPQKYLEPNRLDIKFFWTLK